MKKAIWKYPIRPDLNEEALEMPKGAKILTVQMQSGGPMLWAMVDPDAEKEKRKFFVATTGAPFEDSEVGLYVDTFQMKGMNMKGENFDLVFHLFERDENGSRRLV